LFIFYFSFSDVLEDSLASLHDRPLTGSKKDDEVSSGKPPTMKRNQDAVRSTTSLRDEVIYETDDFESETEVTSQENIKKASGRKSVVKRKDTPVLNRQQQEYVSSTSNEDNGNIRLTASSSLSTLPSALSSITARYVKIEFESTWGDRDYLGMTGIHILNPQGNHIKVGNKSVTTDQNSSLLSFSDDRSVSNLNNNVNNTANDAFMWLIPYEPSASSSKKLSPYYVEFDLQSSQSISGLRVWNYNGGTTESSLRGVKYAVVYLDRKPYFRLILKPGMEYDGISFDQTIFFSHLVYEIEQHNRTNTLASASNRLVYKTPRLRQTYETANSPCGLLWKFSFYSNHGDDYYIGLDHMDFYDEDNHIISIESFSSMMHIEALPHSVRDLAISSSDPLAVDPRIPEKLFSSKYFTDLNCKTNCWLAPLSKCMTADERDSGVIRTLGSTLNSDNYIKKRKSYVFPHDNTLFVMFDYPVTVSAIR
jgi:hypothetical protein